MQLDNGTVSEARRLIDGRGLGSVSLGSGINAAVLSDIYHDKKNVSRDMENRFRSAVGLPLLPSIEQVEVPPGCEVKVVRPRTKKTRKARKKRYSVPTEPGEAGIYLAERMSKEDLEAMIDAIEEVIYVGGVKIRP